MTRICLQTARYRFLRAPLLQTDRKPVGNIAWREFAGTRRHSPIMAAGHTNTRSAACECAWSGSDERAPKQRTSA